MEIFFSEKLKKMEEENWSKMREFFSMENFF